MGKAIPERVRTLMATFLGDHGVAPPDVRKAAYERARALGSGPALQQEGWARAATAYDPISHRIISADGAKQNAVQSTYACDGATWAQIIKSNATTASSDPNQPLGPCDAATDVTAQRIVMACASSTRPASGARPGGASANGTTWTFDGKAWQSVSAADTPAIPTGPSLLDGAGVFTLAYDPALPAL